MLKYIVLFSVLMILIRLQDWWFETKHGYYYFDKEDEKQCTIVAISTLVSFVLIIIIIACINVITKGV